jgi:hypothetical protein
MGPPRNLDDLSVSQLKALVARLLGEVAELKQTVAAQRAEIARLKGLKGPPSIQPSGMEKATDPVRPSTPEERQGRGKVQPRVRIADRILTATVPLGSRFKGYETYLVQDLGLSVQAIRYHRERWGTPNGRTITARCRKGRRDTLALSCAGLC